MKNVNVNLIFKKIKLCFFTSVNRYKNDKSAPTFKVQRKIAKINKGCVSNMAKKDKQATDYSKLSLPDIIKRKIKRNVTFFELEHDEQRGVLDYIQSHNIDIKVFGCKWYDILSGKFFVIEYLPREDSMFSIDEEKREFDTFSDFFKYVRGDIYENSCFYGYDFSAEEIDEFSINIESLNFSSLINETIDDYTFESINNIRKENIGVYADRSKAIIKWFERSKPITTLKDLEAKYKQFVETFDFWEAKYVFFSMLLRKDKNLVKEAVIEFLCKHDVNDGITFDSILLKYGRESALYVIDNFDGFYSYTTKRRRIRNFKDALAGYDSGTFVLQRRLGFDESLQLYYVRDRYYNDKNYSLTNNEFFGDFLGFASFVKGDLSDADLSKAPVSRKEISKYKTNENTKLPLSKIYDAYEVRKKFADDEFVVNQKWIDADGITILEKEHTFTRFFDFVYFLNGDLSNADLLLCNGIENISKIKNLKLKGIQVRSEIAEKLGLPLRLLPKNRFEAKSFESTNKYELETIENLLIEHPEDDDYSGRVSYITDIHLLHRFNAYKCKTPEDVSCVIRTIAKTLGEQATGVNLIGGDTSSDFDIFKVFISNLTEYRERGDFFFTLGNHELWGLNGENFDSIVDKYKIVLEEKGQGRMHLIQNNIFYADGEWKEITEEELSRISLDDLRVKMRSARVIIFGGVGFAGMNNEFNADNGIYMDVLDREEEYAESAKFLALYEKVTSALKGKNLIVFTHMPMRDWGGEDMHAKEGVVYVNGHSHRNFFFDDGKKRIYADNQVGYNGRRISFKQVAIDFNYDWFADYNDGIYQITKEDYENFYRGIGEGLTFNRQYEKLFMIKREETYMFFMQTPKGSMLILNGGSIRKAGNHSLEYFYENIVKYSASVSLFLSKYDNFEKQISNEVKRIGGDGRIHGSIVDIDFYNHLYLNPLDGTITPYFAYSMVDKYVYDNLPSLLKSKCPKLFANYEKMIGQKSDQNALVLYHKNLPITKNREYVDSTEMYKVSRILKGLQFTTKYNIVRLWNDAIVADASEENGKLIVSGIINPDSMPQPVVEPKSRIVREPKSRIAREPKPKVIKPILSEKEKIKIRDDKYKALITSETSGKVIVETYRGSTEKADYRCTICGHTWSTRPDHFKSRQKYKCPICSKENLPGK